MLDMTTIVCLSDTIVLRGLTGNYWALDTSSGNQYKLNDVSYFLLNLLRSPITVIQVVEEVLKEYAVSREQATIDCSGVLQVSLENGIVKEVKS